MHIFQYSYALLAVVLFSFTTPVANAQSAVIDTSEMSQAELYQYAEDMRLGRSMDVDFNKALELHTMLALAGRSQSYERMSRIFFEQDLLQEAKLALEAGRNAGNEFARMRLASSNVQEHFGILSDPEQGFAELVTITQTSDSVYARVMLARAYENGSGTDVQMDKARALYEGLASEGHGQSIQRLGDFARDGAFSSPDLMAAAGYYRAAAESGRDSSWIELAKLNMEQSEYQRAIDAYQLAIAANVSGAGAAYARAHFLAEFGPLSDRAFGATELETKAEAGDVDAAAEALELWERRSRRINSLDLDRVLDILDAKMREGDKKATVALARAYRVLQWRIPQARARHAELVADFGDQLGRSRMRELMFATYDRGRHAESRQALYDMVAAMDGEEFIQGARTLRATERTAFVYLLQRELGELGYFSGSESSVFNRSTLIATMKFCSDYEIEETCIHGPLTYPASMDIIRELAAARG
jgi:tetratricopeptide (TPR) repeat protein